MKPVRFQTTMSPATAAAVRFNAKHERVSTAAYVRNAVMRHIEGSTVLDPVRVALGETSSAVIHHAREVLEATGARMVEEIRAEREGMRQDIRDLLTGLAGLADAVGAPAP